MSYKIFTCRHALNLELGHELVQVGLAYTTHGRLNETRDNVIWVFHALTANSDPAEWWSGLIGAGKLYDPSRYFIVCVNMPGSCYGSISPLTVDPKEGRPYYHHFPFFTPRDMVRAYQQLKDDLQINRIHTGIGGSMGGQQLIEWAIEEPDLFRNIIPIATNAVHSPWGIAFNSSQRMAIEADSSWKEEHPEAGMQGMKAARAMALLSYRHYETYLRAQPRAAGFPFGSGWNGAASYQYYQGEKLARRFNAFSYYVLSQSMDSHDVGRGRGGLRAALARINANSLLIGIRTDILFPEQEQQFIAENIRGAKYQRIESDYGHDGFLLEYEQIEKLIRQFYALNENKLTKQTIA